MITQWRWGRWKPKTKHPPGTSRESAASVSSAAARSTALPNQMPAPALRWVAEGRIALRAFDFDADADAVCAFQPETYALNFPEFSYTPAFAHAFRHDLRRAGLDPCNGLFVLDDGREPNRIAGFLWVVICQNNWTSERFGYVNNLYVVPTRRGHGLARELMRQGEEWFRARGVKKLRLTVTSSNEAAVSLYKNNGYRVQRWEMEKDI